MFCKRKVKLNCELYALLRVINKRVEKIALIKKIQMNDTDEKMWLRLKKK